MANRIVTAAVTGETIKLSEKSAGAAGSFNAVSLAFTFDGAWDGTTSKIVQFLNAYGANPINITLTSGMIVSGAYIVPIPAEPLVYAGEMTVTVRGVDFEIDGTTAERIIVCASTTMKVLNSLYEVGGAVPVEPTPTQAEQLLASVNSVTGMTASATNLPTGQPATVTKTTNGNGTINLAFGLPAGGKGDTGIQGVKGDKGDTGNSVEYVWNGTQLGIRIEGQTEYVYVDLQGVQGEIGLTGAKGEIGLTGAKGDTGSTGAKGDTGNTGATGNGISSVVLVSGTHAAGTIDTYRITFTDTTTFDFTVYNGADGLGSGDMLKATYDTNNSGVVDNAEKVNGLTVLAAVPIGAVFTDTIYTHPANHPPSIITQDASNRFVTDTEKSTWNGKIDASQKGIASGIASLDGTGKVPSGQLPHAGFSNLNLLDNWDFRNPVNQQGQTSYSVGGGIAKSIDRFRIYNCSLAINSGVGITITGNDAYGNSNQLIENYSAYAGKTVTFSAKILGGTAISNGAYVSISDGATETISNITSTGIAFVTKTISASPTKLEATIVTSNVSGKTLQVELAKLELGSVSTLADDPPASYGEQLARCMGAPVSIGGSGNLAAIATGSYTGTGTYGTSNKNSVVSGSTPKLIVITSNNEDDMPLIMVNPASYVYYHAGNSSVGQFVEIAWGTTTTWWNTSAANYQYNRTGTAYKYAILI